ncbi:MAG TPA: DMT family transporter [Candidatus Paceibacterota bacterium]
MISNTTQNNGIAIALTTAFVSGFAVFINKFGVVFWVNSSAYTTAKNLVAAMILTACVLLWGKMGELRRLSKKQWVQLLLIAFVGGSVPFLLFFKSLTIISATEAAFIHKTLFVWVAIMALPFLKERLGIIQLFGLLALFLAVYIAGAPAKWSLGAGSAMALGATMLWAAETIIVKKTLAGISTTTVAWARMFFGSLFLMLWLLFTGEIADVIPSSLSQGFWAVGVGVVLFGYVIGWYSALQRAPATIVSSVLVLAAPITAILDGAMMRRAVPTKIIIYFALALLGIFLMTKLEYYYSKFAKKEEVFSA